MHHRTSFLARGKAKKKQAWGMKVSALECVGTYLYSREIEIKCSWATIYQATINTEKEEKSAITVCLPHILCFNCPGLSNSQFFFFFPLNQWLPPCLSIISSCELYSQFQRMLWYAEESGNDSRTLQNWFRGPIPCSLGAVFPSTFVYYNLLNSSEFQGSQTILIQ